jgi:ribosomal protein L37E
MLQKQEAERIAHERRNAGLCQHCGGRFKGIFKKTCTACGKPKDY